MAGETVLVHAAAGGFGQAAIVIAQHAGARVIATCSSEAKRDILVKHFDIPFDHVLSSRDNSFAPEVLRLTHGRGADVVLNSLSGAMLKATWNCIARFGRFIEVGKVDMEASRFLDMKPFCRCATFASVDLLQLKDHNPSLLREALQEGLKICNQRGRAPLEPITPYPMSQVEDTMRLMQSGKHIGKLVLVPGAEDMVKIVPRQQPINLKDPETTYLVVGGVTGIGVAVVQWMMHKGAKSMLLVSRHATSHNNAFKLKAEGQKLGCDVQLRDCDCSDELSLIELLDQASRTLPPIRGVIIGAMVLNDTVMERMEYSQWAHTIRSKIQVSYNLHQHCSKDLSFFIMLSSALGVTGGLSQANYAAGNTYQDALARHRNKAGLPAVTLDLCGVRKVGYVEDRVGSGDHGIIDRISKSGVVTLDVEVVLRLIEAAIRNPLRACPDDSQVVVGITARSISAVADATVPFARDLRFGSLRLADSTHTDRAATHPNSSDKNSTVALIRALSAVDTTLPEASALLADALAIKLADMFSMSRPDVDLELPLSDYGIDSLVAIELRNWISVTVKAKVSVLDIVQSTSLMDFATLVATRSDLFSTKQGLFS